MAHAREVKRVVRLNRGAEAERKAVSPAKVPQPCMLRPIVRRVGVGGSVERTSLLSLGLSHVGFGLRILRGRGHASGIGERGKSVVLVC